MESRIFGGRQMPAALALLLLAALTLLAFTANADARGKGKPTKGPSGLAFYSPDKVPGGHGKLIWQRNAKAGVKLKKAKTNKLVLYSSRSPQGERIAVSGSISLPKGKAPKKGWPVISYAHGTTGVADSCAPSRNKPGGVADAYINYTDPQLNSWLKAGYAVLRTDYQGLGTEGPHPYLVGTSEGRSVLDIVRAARDLYPKVGKKFLIAGHSQGGHAALFAASLAKSWTPDLKLRGTVAYSPASHLKTQAQALPALISPSSLSALATLIVAGMTTTDSAIDPALILDDAPLALYPQVETKCLSQLSQPSSFGQFAPADLVRDGADLGPLYAALDAANPAVKAAAPILVAQGDADGTVFKAFTDQLVTELGGLDNAVTYETYAGVDHGGVVAAAEPDAMAFFESRLKGAK